MLIQINFNYWPKLYLPRIWFNVVVAQLRIGLPKERQKRTPRVPRDARNIGALQELVPHFKSIVTLVVEKSVQNQRPIGNCSVQAQMTICGALGISESEMIEIWQILSVVQLFNKLGSLAL
jgi:hypothetical protein